MLIKTEDSKKKGKHLNIAPLQPPTLAAFLPWGDSEGAGRVRLSLCKYSNIFLFHRKGIEDEGEDVIHAVELADALGAHEDDVEGLFVFFLVFCHYLAAGTAGGGGAFTEYTVVCAGYGKGVKGNIRVVCTCKEHYRALCAEA